MKLVNVTVADSTEGSPWVRLLANAFLSPSLSLLICKVGITATSLRGSEGGQNEVRQKTLHTDWKATWIVIT